MSTSATSLGVLLVVGVLTPAALVGALRLGAGRSRAPRVGPVWLDIRADRLPWVGVGVLVGTAVLLAAAVAIAGGAVNRAMGLVVTVGMVAAGALGAAWLRARERSAPG